jgi:hypothetical protein
VGSLRNLPSPRAGRQGECRRNGDNSKKTGDRYAQEAARPAWPRVPDITRDELIEVTQRILDGPAGPDCPYYLLILQANVPHPAITDLIYQPAAGTESTAEEIIDAALSYRPIASWPLGGYRRPDIGQRKRYLCPASRAMAASRVSASRVAATSWVRM